MYLEKRHRATVHEAQEYNEEEVTEVERSVSRNQQWTHTITCVSQDFFQEKKETIYILSFNDDFYLFYGFCVSFSISFHFATFWHTQHT